MGNNPKRRKYWNNPYKLDYCEKENIYTISFKDNKGTKHIVEVNEEVYKAFDSFELEDISQMHKFERHIEHSEIYENNLNKRAIHKPREVDEIVNDNFLAKDLKEAIGNLTEKQRRRIKMYYFDDMSLQEIAKLERTTHQAISKSISKSIVQLRKILKK